ncbi:hypothetical protein JYT23_00500 [Mariprofundus ferrooxydans]|nr:hypothetical protein [Mariprofundus ferrooxydans]
MKKSHYIAVAAATLLISSTAWAGALTIPNTFTAGTPAVAADVNANFTAAKTAVDDNNTRITANTASATTNTTDIAANVTNITALQNSKAGYAKAISPNGPNGFNTPVFLTATGTPVVTMTLNVPAAGFAIVTGRAFSGLVHTLGTLDIVAIKVSATSGDIANSYDLSASRASANQPTDTYGINISASSVIPVVAGANTIYLNAYIPQGTGHYLTQPELTAIYVPNAY